jgi:hypothetical protein
MAAEALMPRYPVYIPSKGRAEHCLAARELLKDGVPFRLVVEPQEREAYAAKFGAERLLVLPFANLGSVVPARNWIRDHATAAGCVRHWQLDDNLYGFYRVWRGQRLLCRAGMALRLTEDFVDRYENVAIAGLNYDMFYVATHDKIPPFYLNHRVYSCTLFLNALPHRWRGRYNEDTDICLQVLADGWCTIFMNAFLAKKKWTMQMRGGNTDELYQGDGRLKMARALERVWPGVVQTHRRFKRPQHVVHDSWKKFDTPLKLKPGIDPARLSRDERGIKLVAVQPIKSAFLRRLVRQYGERNGAKR